MDSKNKYRLRVETCIGTIIDVHKSVSYPDEHKEFVTQFEELKKAINNMDMNRVSEKDIQMVEKATNALLGDFMPIFETGDYSPVYQRLKH